MAKGEIRNELGNCLVQTIALSVAAAGCATSPPSESHQPARAAGPGLVACRDEAPETRDLVVTGAGKAQIVPVLLEGLRFDGIDPPQATVMALVFKADEGFSLRLSPKTAVALRPAGPVAASHVAIGRNGTLRSFAARTLRISAQGATTSVCAGGFLMDMTPDLAAAVDSNTEAAAHIPGEWASVWVLFPLDGDEAAGIREFRIGDLTVKVSSRKDMDGQPPPARRMMPVPGGRFTVGVGDGADHGGHAAHKVTLSPFKIDELPVTVSDYRECVRAGQCQVPRTIWKGCQYGEKGRDRHPMNCVTYDNAERFCRWAGGRLPTEEEWERSARGDDGRIFPWGASPVDDTRLCRAPDDDSCEVGKHPLGASPYGVQDLMGGRNEWTSSKMCWYPETDCSSDSKVTRGGCRYRATNDGYAEKCLRYGAARVFDALPADNRPALGFRCAR